MIHNWHCISAYSLMKCANLARALLNSRKCCRSTACVGFRVVFNCTHSWLGPSACGDTFAVTHGHLSAGGIDANDKLLQGRSKRVFGAVHKS